MRTVASIGLVLAGAAASCSSPQPTVKIRAAAQAPQVIGVGEAEAQLAFGNVALALEGFRKVIREQPNDVRALVGIAHSYERMGRFDLSRKWYETALASAPANSSVLLEFAAFLDRQRLPLEAASVRAEAVERSQLATLAAPESAAPKPAEVAAGETAASITLALPPPRPANPREGRTDAGQPSVQDVSTAQPQPRLERLSLGEVALITRSEPVWSAELVKRSPRSVTFRFVSVRPVARLLNAARLQGLAAHTRAQLVERGWKRIEIGDAPAVRERTLVLFPQSQRSVAERLASQFGFTHLRPFNGPDIVVLLGRDAARLKSLHSV